MNETITYLPQERLFDVFCDTVPDALFPSYWKKERVNEGCFEVTSSTGVNVRYQLQKEWNQKHIQKAQFPICFIKREYTEGIIFYSFTAHDLGKEEYAIHALVHHFDLEYKLNRTRRTYESGGEVNLNVNSKTHEFITLEQAFQQMFSHDPAYRLWAVTRNIFEEKGTNV